MAFYGLIPEGTGGRVVEIQMQVNIHEEGPDIRLLGLPQRALTTHRLMWENALQSCGLSLPAAQVTVNLHPANIKKPDTTLEAAIATLLALEALVMEEGEPEELFEKEIDDLELDEIRKRNLKRRQQRKRLYEDDWVIVGELSLDGTITRTRSLLGMIAHSPEGASIIVPEDAVNEAVLLHMDTKRADTKIFPAKRLDQVVNHILGTEKLKAHRCPARFKPGALVKKPRDFANIVGQELAKRSLEIAAAGGHSVLLYGPKGNGKTTLANALSAILPALTKNECLEINKIYSAKNLIHDGEIVVRRPFRPVESTASSEALQGGIGSSGHIEPGEMSLAHRGVLFLDELPDFRRDVVTKLKGPLEAGKVSINRASGSVEFPCQFMLVAAVNPCNCGYYGEYECPICKKTIDNRRGYCEVHPDTNTSHRCNCRGSEVKSYLGRLNGPFLDRIDLKVRTYSLDPSQLLAPANAESTEVIQKRVKRARLMQEKRYAGTGMRLNVDLKDVVAGLPLLRLSEHDRAELQELMREKNLSARGMVKVLQVGRTIADLNGSAELTMSHLLQALGFMGSVFTEEEVLLQVGDTEHAMGPVDNADNMLRMVEHILKEMARRRLSENRCAKEIKISVPTLKKVLRREFNLHKTTLSKINGWLQRSPEKNLSARRR